MNINSLSRWRMDITTLSPIHIGSGEEIDPFQYVIDGNVLYEFSPTELIQTTKGKTNELTKIVDRTTNPGSILLDVQKFFHNQSDAAIAKSIRALKVAPGVSILYRERLGKHAQLDSKELNRLVIKQMQRNPVDSIPFLPGSSLKGAIRTALLDSINQGQSSSITDSMKLQQKLFQYDTIENDPMRLVHIADGNWTEKYTENELVAVSEVIFAVNRKKKASKVQNQKQGLSQILEVTAAPKLRAFRSEILLCKPYPAPTKPLSWTMQEIASACNQYYFRYFEKELGQLKEREFLDKNWGDDVLEYVNSKLHQPSDSRCSFLLRIGHHSGAESVTLNGVRKITIRGAAGNNQESDHSTTWWLASSQQNASSGLKPFGWILVECSSVDAMSGSPNDSEQFFLRSQGDSDGWSDHAKSKKREMSERLSENLKREEEIHLRKQKQIFEERERTERYEKLSNEEKILENFKEKIKELKKMNSRPQSGSELSGLAADLLKHADEWSMPLRQQAAQMLEEFYDWVGWGKGEKKRQRKNRISKLRNNQP